MCSRIVLPLSCLLLAGVVVFGAPVKDEGIEAQKKSAPVKEVQNQDHDLEDLLSLVNQESQQKNVMVHKEHVSHFENNNGEKVKIEEKEEKVFDTKTGDVIADVKQEVKQEASGDETEPETVVETKVDIPSEDVHETFVQDGEEANAATEEEESIDASQDPELTPADMAEYLFVTEQFAAFYSALDRLVNQSKMTAEDAEEYASTVALEYEKLQLEDFENRILSEKRFYPQVPPMADIYGQAPPSDFYPQAGPAYVPDESMYPPMENYGYGPAYMPAEDQYLPYAGGDVSDGSDVSPVEFLAALWDEAYGKGNVEAQEIVKMLYDRVSNDANPDDMAQIKDLLVNTVDSSLNDYPQNYPMETLQNDVAPPPAAASANQNEENNEEAELQSVLANDNEEEEELESVASNNKEAEAETGSESTNESEEETESKSEAANDNSVEVPQDVIQGQKRSVENVMEQKGAAM